MPYEDVTDTDKIKKEIKKKLAEPDAADEVVAAIALACSNTDPDGDPMNQWLGIFADVIGVKAQKWVGSKDLIEIYPSGTHGNGGEDRLEFQVGATQVKVTRAYKSKHTE